MKDIKNKSGFTLVEILVVIAILAVIFAIAQPTYYMISTRVKQSSYENKVKYIETAASQYGEDTSSTLVFVDTLIREGYLEADDEEGNIYDPRDESLLNCFLVSIYYDSDQVYSSLGIEKAVLENENTCDFNRVEIQSSILNFTAHEVTNETGTMWKNEVLETGKWTRSDVILIVDINPEMKNQVSKITFVGGGVKEERSVSKNFDSRNKYLVQALQLVNTTFNVNVEVNEVNESGEEQINIYTSTLKVMIDKQPPIIYQDDIKVERADEWTNYAKEVEVVSSDQSGSGIYGYYFTTEDGTCSTDLSDYTMVESNNSGIFHTRLLKGIYHICVIDQAGNISNKATFAVHKTDQNDPIITEFSYLGTAYANPEYYQKLQLLIHTADNVTTNESGVRFVKYCVTTDSSHRCEPDILLEVDENEIAYFDFPDSDEKQTFCVKPIDYAGNESEGIRCYQPVWVKSKVNVGDACKMCNASNNYCNESIYIRYGSKNFTLYRSSSNSCFGYSNFTITTPLINTFCCDTGACHQEHVYDPYIGVIGIRNSLISVYNKLPSTGTFLNQEAYLYGSVSRNSFQNAPSTAEPEARLKITEFSLNKFPSTINQGYNYGLPSETLDEVTCTIGNTQYQIVDGDDFPVGEKITITCRRKVEQSDPSISDDFDQNTPEGEVVPEEQYEEIEKTVVVASNPDFEENHDQIGNATGTHLTTTQLIKYSGNVKSIKSRYGLLDIVDYQAIRNKPYAANLNTLLSTVVLGVVYSKEGSVDWNSAFGHNPTNWRFNSSISAIYVTPKGFEAVTPMQYGARPAVMSVPFKRNVDIQSGLGSSSDPFIVK